MAEKRRQNLAETDKGSYYNQEEWLNKFLDYKGAFYDGSENDDGENDYKELHWKYRSSRLQMFFKKSILKSFENFTEKHLRWNSFLIKLQVLRTATLFKTDSNTDVFLWNLPTF